MFAESGQKAKLIDELNSLFSMQKSLCKVYEASPEDVAVETNVFLVMIIFLQPKSMNTWKNLKSFDYLDLEVLADQLKHLNLTA